MREYEDFNECDIVHEYEYGATIKELTFMFDMPEGEIKRILKEHGINSRCKIKRLPDNLSGGRTLAITKDGKLEEIRTCYDE